MTGTARLRERLIELRDDALDGMLIEGAAGRAVVSDDGRKIRLTLYAEAGALAAVVLDPVRAVALAQRLIAAALPRLSLRIE